MLTKDAFGNFENGCLAAARAAGERDELRSMRGPPASTSPMAKLNWRHA